VNVEIDAEGFARRYVDGLCKVLRALPFSDLAKAMDALERAHAEGRQVFIAGNGGSAATAAHMANDWLKGVAAAGRGGLRAISLADCIPTLTAIANDESYEQVFAIPLETLARRGDVLVVVTGSGNSPNVLRAVASASRLGLRTIGFLGKGGGRVRDILDIEVTVPSDEYGPIEDAHICFDHLITCWLVERLRGGA
jgi:D-sedoheptulose 7-phosphate isomerase